MGYKCDVCEQEEGSVFCFADGAVLCQQCDNSVHGDTKSAQKHERVQLTPSSHTQQCDICQEQDAVMFCSEDRALICRRCDLMIHSANAHTAKHHRLLLVGMDVGLTALPLPGEGGRTEEGTSRRLRRHAQPQPQQQLPPATTATSHATGSHQQQSSNTRQPEAQQPTFHMPHAPSSGNLINTGVAVSQGAAALLSPFGAPGAFPHPFGNDDGHGASTSAAASALDFMNANSGALAPAIPWQDRPSSMTLAAELLGVPSVSNGFTAKDIDAAYMLGSSADLDAGLSALLEVPDFDSHSSPSDHDLFSGGMMGMPAAGTLQQPMASGYKHKDVPGDGIVPDLFGPAAKRQRA